MGVGTIEMKLKDTHTLYFYFYRFVGTCSKSKQKSEIGSITFGLAVKNISETPGLSDFLLV